MERGYNTVEAEEKAEGSRTKISWHARGVVKRKRGGAVEWMRAAGQRLHALPSAYGAPVLRAHGWQ